MQCDYLAICERISYYDFEWCNLAKFMINAARFGEQSKTTKGLEHNPARIHIIKALRDVLDGSMGIHLMLADATHLTDYAIDIAKSIEAGYMVDDKVEELQTKLNAIYQPKEEDDDDDLAAEASLDAKPVSNSFGVVRYYNDGDTSEIDYLVLFNDGPQWSNHAGNATRMDLTTANGFCYIYNKYFGLEESGFHCYLVAFT